MPEGGTNRFATILYYLSDIDEGGETVFPLSNAPAQPYFHNRNGEFIQTNPTDCSAASDGYLVIYDCINSGSVLGLACGVPRGASDLE